MYSSHQLYVMVGAGLVAALIVGVSTLTLMVTQWP
jgi:hypothetical protein